MYQDTSRASYQEVLPKLGLRQRAVLNALTEPMTNLELSKKLGWAINCVTGRVVELRGHDLVELHCRRPCRVSGRTAIAWRVKVPGTLF